MLPDFRVRQRDYLLEISRAITQELDLEQLLVRILDISIEMLAGQAGLIAFREIPGGWKIASSRGITPAFLRHVEPLLSEVPEQEEPSLEELPQIDRLLQRITLVASLGLLTGVALPLIVRKQILGVIFIFRNYAGVFSSNDTALLKSFADQAAIAIYNAKLYSEVSQEKSRLDALLDSVADGILILDANHLIEHCNPAFSRMLGLPSSQILNHHHDEIIHLAKPKNNLTLEVAEMGGWPLTQHATLYVEGDLEKPVGGSLPVGITYAPLQAANGKLMNIIASFRDITRFREADELKATFVSVISHELKTPVALIKGYVSTLRREDVVWDREVIEDSLKVIEEEADHLTELIENLLDASRLQAGALSMNLSDVALDKLANQIVDKFKTQTQRHTFKVNFPDEFPLILADETRISQVFTNLLSNAIKYSPAGGEITIEGSVRHDHVIVCVSDQGSGIAAVDIPHLFDRFYRSKESSRTTKGAGLGLYLSRAVIEAHGGRIWVDPKKEDGARICFSLPKDRH